MKINNHEFELYIPASKIQERILELADVINHDYEGKNPLFLSVLNGAFIFSADFIREVTIPSEISFIKISSYEDMQTTGNFRDLIGLQENVFNRHLIIIEDIIDTGNTLQHLFKNLETLGPASMEVVSLLYKPDAYQQDMPVKYVGFKIPPKFVIGYGLDYNGQGRNLRDLYQINE